MAQLWEWQSHSPLTTVLITLSLPIPSATSYFQVTDFQTQANPPQTEMLILVSAYCSEMGADSLWNAAMERALAFLALFPENFSTEMTQ